MSDPSDEHGDSPADQGDRSGEIADDLGTDREEYENESDDDGHALPEEDLQYPTVEFEHGRLDDDGSFEFSEDADRDGMSAVAEAIADAPSSHDLGVETPDGFTTLGVAPERVEARFDPDEDHRGDLVVTFRLSARTMFVADDHDTKVGSRGGKGFVPLSMLSEDGEEYRCYGWIDDPGDPG